MTVKIVFSPLKNNRSRVNLYTYYQREESCNSLKIFIYNKPSSNLEKEHNKQTLELAENIKAKTILAIQNGHYNIHTGFKNQASFLDFFYSLVKERRKQEGNYGNWMSAYKHLLAFSKGKIVRFCDCDDNFINGFKKYLQTAKVTKSGTCLSNNSSISYLNKLKAALTEAVNRKIIFDNPGKRVKGIKQEENSREFLLAEELQILAKTECSYPLLKNAFLFSCLSGLRWSDVNKLTWGEVTYSEIEKIWKIHFRQKKTKGLQYNPISQEACDLLGTRKASDERVFKGLKYSAWNNHLLQEWIWKDANISKKITFHCARHTYATLLLTSGADIYTVSKLLGHQDLKTTEIYAKIISTHKNSVVALLPSINI